jgi:hypothetical protein
MSDNLQADPRWIKLHDRTWICPCCGEAHAGIFDLACGKPDFWPGAEDKRPNSALSKASNFLSEDFCVLNGEHFFIRCVLQLKILGSEGQFFGFGTWSTLSEKNFDLYVDTFDSGEQDNLGPWFGWFSNRLKGYPDTLSLKCRAHPRGGRQRPNIELEPTEHPLAQDQANGITFDRLLDLYAANGHDLRAALSTE